MKKTPPIKPVVAPPDLIGGPADQGAFGGGRIGSSLRLHRISDARAVAWGGQVRYVVIPLMRAARFRANKLRERLGKHERLAEVMQRLDRVEE